jgi:hypothetical protein
VGVGLGVLDDVGGLTELAAALDRVHHDAPRAPVGGQHVPAARVHRQMARLRAAARLGAEQAKAPVVADGERADEPTVELVHGI